MIKNYTARNKCPICNRYKTAYKDKCHGFLTSDGKYAYCSREMGQEGQRQTQTHYGKPLYRHSLTETITTTTASKTPLPPPQSVSVKDTIPEGVASSQWSQDTMEHELEKIIQQRQQAGQWPYQSAAEPEQPSEPSESQEPDPPLSQRTQTPESSRFPWQSQS